MDNSDDMLSIEEAARYKGVGRRTIGKAIKEGRLSATVVGTYRNGGAIWRIRCSDLDTYKPVLKDNDRDERIASDYRNGITSVKRLAERYGVSPSTVGRVLVAHGFPRKPRRLRRAVVEALLKQGATVAEIAETFDADPHAVHKLRRDAGIPYRLKEKNLPIPDNAIIQYLAGFFDGEGCIQIVRTNEKKHPQYDLRIMVANTHEGVLRRLVEAFGCGCISHRRQRAHWRMCFFWVCSCRDAEHVLKLIAPYLIVKREQVRIALDVQKVKRARPSYRYHDPALTQWYEDMRIKVQELKRT